MNEGTFTALRAFSISASRSMIGTAQISPMVSGVIR